MSHGKYVVSARFYSVPHLSNAFCTGILIKIAMPTSKTTRILIKITMPTSKTTRFLIKIMMPRSKNSVSTTFSNVWSESGFDKPVFYWYFDDLIAAEKSFIRLRGAFPNIFRRSYEDQSVKFVPHKLPKEVLIILAPH